MSGRRCFITKNYLFVICFSLVLNILNLFYSSEVNSEGSNTEMKTRWNWILPEPTGNILYSVYFTNRLTGYAAGALGTIIKTTDGGKSWDALSSGTLNDLSEIFFINNSDGFAVGNSGTILKTHDGGFSWKVIPSGTNSYLHDIVFPAGSTGYCAGLNGSILKSKDKGNSWCPLTSGLDSPLFCMDFLNDSTGAAGGYNIILKTTNGGNSWDIQKINFSPSCTIVSISYIDNRIIYAAGNIPGGSFYKTTDGGLNWNSQTLSLPNLFGGSVDLVRSMSFINKNSGFIVTDFGTILKTTNGGSNWLWDSSFRPSYTKLSVMYDINTADSNFINISGSGGTVISTSNAGLNWTAKAGNRKTIRGSYFLDSKTGYASGELGELLKTTDGGLSWLELNEFTTKFLNSVFFINEKIGFAAGDSGVIFKTTDEGNSWTDQTNYKKYNINCVRFTNEESGIVAGGNPENNRAFIYKTDDGGNSWYEVYDSLSLGVLNSAVFMDGVNGIAVGYNGNALYSYDGGESWTTTNISPVNLYSISFSDNLNGLISGANGLFYKTTDGGISWNNVLSRNYKNFYSVKFKDNYFAAASGEGGTILLSFNGGFDWTQEQRITTNDLYSIGLTYDFRIFAFGEYGTVIYSNMNKLKMTSDSSVLKTDKSYILTQNYPNPFNPVTVIRYSLSESGFVSVKVFDLTGKEVTSLVNERKYKGEFRITFNGSYLSSGVYYYCLYVNEQRTEAKRMVLLK